LRPRALPGCTPAAETPAAFVVGGIGGFDSIEHRDRIVGRLKLQTAGRQIQRLGVIVAFVRGTRPRRADRTEKTATASRGAALDGGTKFAQQLTERRADLRHSRCGGWAPRFREEGGMSLVRLLGFTTLACGCVIGRYREVATSREVSYVEEKGKSCGSHGHRRNHTLAAERLATAPTAKAS
jgi:hypothetical protein